MAANPKTDPTTAPAMTPGDVAFELLGVDPDPPAMAVDSVFDLELELGKDDDAGTGQPTVGKLGANPSIGWANACAMVSVATQGSMFVSPSESYFSAVTVCDKVKSL